MPVICLFVIQSLSFPLSVVSQRHTPANNLSQVSAVADSNDASQSPLSPSSPWAEPD